MPRPETSRTKRKEKKSAKTPSSANEKAPASEKAISPEELRLLLGARQLVESELEEREEPLTIENRAETEAELLEMIKENGYYFDGADTLVAGYVHNRLSPLYEEKLLEFAGRTEKLNDTLALYELRSEWTESAENFLDAFRRKCPTEVGHYWMDFEEGFRARGIQTQAYVEILKYGALAQAAAKKLMLELEDALRKKNVDVTISVENATPQEDTIDKIDFWVIVDCKGRTKRIPCQVTYLNLESGVRQDKIECGEFIKRNYINFRLPDNRGLRYRNPRLEDKIHTFYHRNSGPKGDEPAIFIILPRAGNQTLLDDGTVNKVVDQAFLDSAVNNMDLWESFIP